MAKVALCLHGCCLYLCNIDPIDDISKDSLTKFDVRCRRCPHDICSPSVDQFVQLRGGILCSRAFLNKELSRFLEALP